MSIILARKLKLMAGPQTAYQFPPHRQKWLHQITLPPHCSQQETPSDSSPTETLWPSAITPPHQMQLRLRGAGIHGPARRPTTVPMEASGRCIPIEDAGKLFYYCPHSCQALDSTARALSRQHGYWLSASGTRLSRWEPR